MFDEKGQIIIDKEEVEMDADELMMFALDAGAEDFSEEEDSYEIITDPADFDAVRQALQFCLEGKIDLCVECNPLHGPLVAGIIRRLEQGDILSKKNYTVETSFTADSLSPEIIDAREY